MRHMDTRAGQDIVRLYFYRDTRAVRARWMLEELGLRYDLSVVDLAHNAHKRDDYLRIHPLGKVPALLIDGSVIFESLAICLYLGDRHWQSDLAPVPEEICRRADYYKWMAYSTGTLEPAVLEQMRIRKAREEGVEAVDLGPALTPFRSAAGYLNDTLSRRPFLLGDQFSAADLMNGAVMMLADDMKLVGDFEHVKAWVDTLRLRPAFQRAKSAGDKGTS